MEYWFEVWSKCFMSAFPTFPGWRPSAAVCVCVRRRRWFCVKHRCMHTHTHSFVWAGGARVRYSHEWGNKHRHLLLVWVGLCVHAPAHHLHDLAADKQHHGSRLRSSGWGSLLYVTKGRIILQDLWQWQGYFPLLHFFKGLKLLACSHNIIAYQ